MGHLSTPESAFIGTVLEAFFYGAYLITFAMYLRVQKTTGGNFLHYPLIFLVVLCTIYFGCDVSLQYTGIFRNKAHHILVLNLNLATSTLYAIVDVVSQAVLIYRCWVMWGGQLWLIIVPSLLSLTSFVTQLVLVGELNLKHDVAHELPSWFFAMGVASFSISLAVNTIITGLLVLKLMLVHQDYKRSVKEVKVMGTDLRPLMAMLIESGMLTFLGQLLWVVLFKLQVPAFNVVGGSITMLYGITPTIVVVRVKMGTTYESKTAGSVKSTALRFKVYDGNHTGTASVGQTTTGPTHVGRSTDELEKGTGSERGSR